MFQSGQDDDEHHDCGMLMVAEHVGIIMLMRTAVIWHRVVVTCSMPSSRLLVASGTKSAKYLQTKGHQIYQQLTTDENVVVCAMINELPARVVKPVFELVMADTKAALFRKHFREQTRTTITTAGIPMSSLA